MSSRAQVLCTVIGYQALAAIPTAAMPAFVGQYVEGYGYSLQQAGWIASAETVGMAVGQLIVFLWFARAGWNLRGSITVALTVFALTQLLSMWSEHSSLLATARFASGVTGGGIVSATAALFIAGLDKPDRPYAALYGSLFVVGPLGLFLLPKFFQSVGLDGVYLGLAAISLLSLLAIRRYPLHRANVRVEGLAAERSPAQLAIIAFILLSLLVNYVSNGGVWMYMERIGESMSIPADQRAIYLSVGMATGVLGALAAAAIGQRAQRTLAIIAGQLALLASYAVLLLADEARAFLVAVILLNVAVPFFTPFYLSALSRADVSGRGATLGLLTVNIGYGIGPAVLAAFVGNGGFHGPLVVASIAVGFSLALLGIGSLAEQRHPMPLRALT